SARPPANQHFGPKPNIVLAVVSQPEAVADGDTVLFPEAAQRLYGDAAQRRFACIRPIASRPYCPGVVLDNCTYAGGMLQVRVGSQLAVLPPSQTAGGTDPEAAVARAEYSREMCAGQILSLRRLPRHEPDSIETQQPLRSCYPEKPVGGLSNIGRGRDGAILDAPHRVTILGDPPVRINRERTGKRYEQKARQHGSQYEDASCPYSDDHHLVPPCS